MSSTDYTIISSYSVPYIAEFKKQKIRIKNKHVFKVKLTMITGLDKKSIIHY